MFSRRTVIVLGAGSSHEAKLPLGSTLLAEIRQLFNVSKSDYNRSINSVSDEIINPVRQKEMAEAQCKPGRDVAKIMNNYYQQGRLLSSGILLANSIDDLLDIHRENKEMQLMGKLAIINRIQSAESRSLLMPSQTNGYDQIDLSKLQNTYYVKLFKMITKGVSKYEVGSLFDKLSFISFNYDRTLEYFLFSAIQQLYGIDHDAASAVVRSVRIWHPYGTIGRLTSIHPNSESTKYGDLSLSTEQLRLVPQIRTYTEQAEHADFMDEMLNEVADAQCIIFLGFGFHKQNLDLIQPIKTSINRAIFATATGISTPNTLSIKDRLHTFFPSEGVNGYSQVHIRNDLTCSQFLDEYAMQLAE